MPSGPLNPQALNRYSYVLNNPLRYVDPTGHEEVKLTAKQIEDLKYLMKDFKDIIALAQIYGNTVLGGLAVKYSESKEALAGIALVGLHVNYNLASMSREVDNILDVLDEAKAVADQSGGIARITIEKSDFAQFFVRLTCDGCRSTTYFEDYPVLGDRNPTALLAWAYLNTFSAKQVFLPTVTR